MSHPGRVTATPRLVMGLVVMAVGAPLTLDNFGLLDSRRFWRLWPVVLVAIGLTKLQPVERASAAGPMGSASSPSGSLSSLVNFGLLRIRQLFAARSCSVVGAASSSGRSAERGRSRRGRRLAVATALIDAFAFMGGRDSEASSATDFRGGNASPSWAAARSTSGRPRSRRVSRRLRHASP